MVENPLKMVQNGLKTMFLCKKVRVFTLPEAYRNDVFVMGFWISLVKVILRGDEML